MICIVIKGPTIEDARQQIAKAALSADLVELCIDRFQDWNISSIRKLRSEFSIPMIFTIRSKQQGGHYPFSEEKRLADLKELAKLQPDYLDLEYPIPLTFVEEINPRIKLIVSSHDSSMNLEQLYQEMKKIPAHFYKIAMTARDSVEAMQFCCWAYQRDKNLIAISMGQAGQFTRVLGPILGNPITYAALEEGLESAPGQILASTLLKRFHYRSLNSETAVYGLIGDPVTYSISDETHNPLFEALGINAVYVKIVIKPEQLAEFLQLAKRLPFKGLSVTMPLKEAIIPHLDHVDPEALLIGAVNTLLFNESKISGFNTDGKGALDAIEQNCAVKNKRIVLLGAGGAAKAIAYEAKKRGGLVTIVNRDIERGKNLATQLQCNAKGLDHMSECVKEGYDILINSTPIAMPIADHDILPHTLVMEIKTKPKDSILLDLARSKECKIVYGYQMFIEQAIGQYAIWLNPQIDRQKCRLILHAQAEKSLLNT